MARARTINGLKPNGTVRANARKIIAVRSAEFFAFAPYLADPASVTELHDMRIAAKRLRYTLELFKDALDPDAAACITLVKDFQEVVGDIHDHDVLVDILRAHLETLNAERAQALAILAIASTHDESIDALKERCRAFVTDSAWVAEQAAIAAAIARATRARHERHTYLVAQWAEWQAAGLRERLEVLAVARPDAHASGKDASPAPTPIALVPHRAADVPDVAGGR